MIMVIRMSTCICEDQKQSPRHLSVSARQQYMSPARELLLLSFGIAQCPKGGQDLIQVICPHLKILIREMMALLQWNDRVIKLLTLVLISIPIQSIIIKESKHISDRQRGQMKAFCMRSISLGQVKNLVLHLPCGISRVGTSLLSCVMRIP